MRTNRSRRTRIRVASAAAIALATITLGGGVAGALNFRSAHNVKGHLVPAGVVQSVGSDTAGGRVTYR